MGTHLIKVSFVIVEFNTIEDIDWCIDSISQLLVNFPFEIIISSNSQYSTYQQKEILEKFPQCIWCFNERNGGFAYAMNRGLRKATGDYLVIMNPDCKIKFGIKKMVSFLQKHPQVGAIAPQIVDEEGNLQDTCREYVSLPSFAYRQLMRVITHKESILNPFFDYQKIQTVDWVIGAFIMVSRKAYERTNGLSEDYFMYAEDLDWCTRIRKAGFEVVYYPKAVVEYKGTRSARKSKKYAKIFLKSHLTYWKKFGFLFGYPKRKEMIFEGFS